MQKWIWLVDAIICGPDVYDGPSLDYARDHHCYVDVVYFPLWSVSENHPHPSHTKIKRNHNHLFKVGKSNRLKLGKTIIAEAYMRFKETKQVMNFPLIINLLIFYLLWIWRLTPYWILGKSSCILLVSDHSGYRKGSLGPLQILEAVLKQSTIIKTCTQQITTCTLLINVP